MSQEHNSKLISELYNAIDEDKIVEILAQMDEIEDGPFLYSIYDKFKIMSDSSISHYFIGSLGKIKGEESKNIIIEIALDQNTEVKNFVWTLDTLSSLSFFEKIVTDKVISLLLSPDFVKDNHYHLGYLLSYIKKANLLTNYEFLLMDYFENNEFSMDSRKIALWYLLRSDTKKYFQHYFENYSKLKADYKAEIIFAKEIVPWSNGIIEKFKQKILSEGGSRAKEIIKASLESTKIKNEVKEKEESIKYGNAPIISEIYDLRSQINIKFSAKFNFDLFNQSELLSKQNKIAGSKSDFNDYCIDLRDLVQKMSDKCQTETKFEDAKKILPDLIEADINKSLNRLALFLHKNNISLDGKIFGLRELNQILNKIAAHPTNDNVVNALKKLDLVNAYTEQNWEFLHKKLLETYKDSLIALNKSIIVN